MSLITVAIFFTCYFFVAVSGLAMCGEGEWAGTTCVELPKCPEYSKPFEGMYRRLRESTCGSEGSTIKICCPNVKLESHPAGNEEAVCGVHVSSNIATHRDGAQAAHKEFPWLALLEYETRNGIIFGCGGVLISDRHVLTSAHCVGPTRKKLTRVRLGEHDLRTAEGCIRQPALENCYGKATIDVGIEKKMVHKNYNNVRRTNVFDSMPHNIAVIKLNQSVTSEFIRPICLPEQLQIQPSEATNQSVDILRHFEVAGWSVMFDTIYPYSLVKMILSMKEVNKNYCNEKYDRSLGKDIMCASSKSSEMACIADEGGPLMHVNSQLKFTVTGIHTPVGSQPWRQNGVPSTFVDVRRYVDWIRLKMEL